MTTPFYKLSLETAIDWYNTGKLTVKGLIFASIACQRKPGSKLVIESVKKYCESLGISERAFYKAKASLIAEDAIYIEIQGRVTLWIDPNADPDTPETEAECVTAQTFSSSARSCSDATYSTARSCSSFARSCSESVNDRAVATERSCSASIYTDLNLDLDPDLSLDRASARKKSEDAIAVDVEILDQENLEKSEPDPAEVSKPPIADKNQDIGKDQSAAEPRDNISMIPADGVYPRNLDGSDRLPWHTSKRYKYNQEFEQYLLRRLAKTSYYKDLPMGEALLQVRKHIQKGDTDMQRRCELEIEWENLWSEDSFGANLTIKDAIAEQELQATVNRFRKLQQQEARKGISNTPTGVIPPTTPPVAATAPPSPQSANHPFSLVPPDPIPESAREKIKEQLKKTHEINEQRRRRA